MEILREINDQELKYIIERLESHLPYAIKDLYYILASQRSKSLCKQFSNISDKVLPKFYTHRSGSKENCTIFGITGERNHSVWFFTFEESLSELTECLENTKLIRWEEGVLFVTIHKEQTSPILNCVEKFNYKLLMNENAIYYWLPKEDALKYEINVPAETYIRQLVEADAHLCNNIWEYKSKKSEEFVRSLILLNGGWALCDKSSNEILSFGLINDHLATGILNTVKHARGKKYGELMAKYLAVKIVENHDLQPTCYINTLSIPSMKLYDKLGYQKIGGSNWIVVGKENP